MRPASSYRGARRNRGKFVPNTQGIIKVRPYVSKSWDWRKGGKAERLAAKNG